MNYKSNLPSQTLPEGTRAALPCEARGQEQTVWLRDGVPVLGVEGPRYRLGERNRLEIRGKVIAIGSLHCSLMNV